MVKLSDQIEDVDRDQAPYRERGGVIKPHVIEHPASISRGDAQIGEISDSMQGVVDLQASNLMHSCTVMCRIRQYTGVL